MKTNRNIALMTVGLACIGIGAQASVNMGSATNFTVLGGASVVNTGLTVVDGNVGVSPGATVTGFGPGIVTNGTIRLNDSSATQAHADAATAFSYIAGLEYTQVLTGQDLGGKTLTPGVYFFSSSAALTGTLNLDGAGEYIFQIGSTLTTASGAVINMMNGASPLATYFQVGSSATLGTGTLFAGNIIALTSQTLTTGVNVSGRIIALNGTVTLDTNNISVVPEPASAILIILGFPLLLAFRKWFRMSI